MTINHFEEVFIDKFVVKQIKDRLLYELSSVKYREKAIWRFSHGAENILKSSKIVFKGTSNNIPELILKYITPEEGYFMSLGEEDGKIYDFDKAIQIIISANMPIIYIMNEVVFIKEEQEKGSPICYLLKT